MTKVTTRGDETVRLETLGFLMEATQYVWEDGRVKKMSRIPAAPSRRAKSSASEPTLHKPTATSGSGPKPWMRHVGKLKHLHKDTEQINQRIEEAFEQIDTETWSDGSVPD